MMVRILAIQALAVCLHYICVVPTMSSSVLLAENQSLDQNSIDMSTLKHRIVKLGRDGNDEEQLLVKVGRSARTNRVFRRDQASSCPVPQVRSMNEWTV
jgi:hypothetical protein